MNGRHRVSGLVLTAALACGLAGCGFGKKLKFEDLKKVKPGMTQSEIEGVLGSGSDASAEDIAKAEQHTGPAGPRANDPVTYKSWKDSKTLLVLGFQNGKVTRSYFTTSDPELSEQLNKDREAQRSKPPQPGGREAGRPGDDWPSELPTQDEAQLHHKMSILAGQLTTYASTHQDRLPANIEELEQWGNWRVIPPDVQQGIRTGQYVISWGAKVDRFDGSKVIAWPQGAKEKGGFVGKTSGTAEKLSADEIKARIAKP